MQKFLIPAIARAYLNRGLAKALLEELSRARYRIDDKEAIRLGS